MCSVIRPCPVTRRTCPCSRDYVNSPLKSRTLHCTQMGIGQGGEGTGPTLVVELPAGSKPKLWESFNAVPSAVSGVSFTIAPSDRVAVRSPRFTRNPPPLTRAQGKRNVAVTLSFTPKTGIDPGGNIRLVDPSAFFATGLAPQMLASTVPSLQIQGGTTTATSVLLVVAPPIAIAATVPFTVCLRTD